MDTTEYTHTQAFTNISEPKIYWAISSHSIGFLIQLLLNIKALAFTRNVIMKPIVITIKCFEDHMKSHNLMVF